YKSASSPPEGGTDAIRRTSGPLPLSTTPTTTIRNTFLMPAWIGVRHQKNIFRVSGGKPCGIQSMKTTKELWLGASRRS
ncbi:unnamed protein product, partial [Clonostachys rosea f. rosea IK726]